MIKPIVSLIILLIATACQADAPADLPTRVSIIEPTASATGSPTPAPTSTATPSATVTPSATAIPSATISSTPTITDTPPPTATLPPTSTPTITPSDPPPTLPPDFTPAALLTPAGFEPPPDARQPLTLPEEFFYGASVQGRNLYARRIGTGSNVIMLVGGIHGGYEANTIDLIDELIAHFRANPTEILPSVSLILIPAANPDGAALGRGTLGGRFNANNVDLNRNWGCGWEPVGFFRNMQVSGGVAPFSEPETQYLASLIFDVRPAAVLFYHSAVNGVFAGDCGGDGRSMELMRVVGAATGYNFGSPFTAYPVSGTAPSWVDSLNIASADVELSRADSTEFERNLRGVLAVQCWVAGEAARADPRCLGYAD